MTRRRKASSSGVEEKKTPVCLAGHDIPADAPMGLCPECLLGLALEAPRDSKRFGEYELLEEIGRGGMGVVHKAQHLRTNRIEALKTILNGELASDEEVYRFHLEAQAASSLDRPNIVPFMLGTALVAGVVGVGRRRSKRATNREKVAPP